MNSTNSDSLNLNLGWCSKLFNPTNSDSLNLILGWYSKMLKSRNLDPNMNLNRFRRNLNLRNAAMEIILVSIFITSL